MKNDVAYIPEVIYVMLNGSLLRHVLIPSSLPSLNISCKIVGLSELYASGYHMQSRHDPCLTIFASTGLLAANVISASHQICQTRIDDSWNPPLKLLPGSFVLCFSSTLIIIVHLFWLCQNLVCESCQALCSDPHQLCVLQCSFLSAHIQQSWFSQLCINTIANSEGNACMNPVVRRQPVEDTHPHNVQCL